MTTPNFGEVVKLNRTIPEDFSFNGKTTRSSFLYGEIPFGGKLSAGSVNTYPSGGGRSVSWHPSGRLLAIGHVTTPHFSVYYFSGTNLVKIPNPTYLPPGTTNTVAWSPDGKFLAVGSSQDPSIVVYSLSLTNVAPTLTMVCTINVAPLAEITWSPDSNYLAVASLVVGAGLKVYSFDGTNLSNPFGPDTLPNALGWIICVSWSNCGRYITIGSYGDQPSPLYMAVYSFGGVDSFDLITTASGANALAGYATKISWSPDTKHIAVAHNAGFKSSVYSFDGSVLKKLASSGVGPSGVGSGVAWSPDGRHYAATVESTPYLVAYSFEDGAVYYTLYNYVGGAPPEGPARDIEWSPDGKFIAVAHDYAPYFTIYTSGIGTIRPGNMLEIEPPSNLPHI